MLNSMLPLCCGRFRFGELSWRWYNETVDGNEGDREEVFMGNLDLLVLASGSKGNAAIVRNTSTGRGILIDCGICKRDFMSRCAELGFNPCDIEAVFISHEHTDHTKGLGVVLRGLEKVGARPLLYASKAVSASSGPIQEVCYGVGARNGAIVEHRAFRAGESIGAAGMQVHVFPTSHDCSECCC